jgi:hypothetical protein
MEYTKGEWEVAVATETGFDTLVLGGDSGVVADTHMSWRNYTENEANAKLISISPDMYELLKDLVTYNDIAFLPIAIQDRVKLVLSKAEGK